jgi:hypothetical protein
MAKIDLCIFYGRTDKDEEKKTNPPFPHCFFPFITLQMQTVCGEYVV